MAIVYICIGSNIGEKKANFERAISLLEAEEKIKIKAKSDFYKTAREGGPQQEDYLNGVLEIETSLSADDCLKTFKRIEKEMGRTSAARNHPRVIDLDILLYDDVVAETEKLTIPHMRMHKRSFVLKGLAEIAPKIKHPVLGKTAKELYQEIKE